MDRFRRMQIFVAVVEARQLTRAADVLHISKSAVSHALSDLENYLGLKLLSRSNKSWRLTDAGETYYNQCKKIIADVEMMEDRARLSSQSLSGLVRISAPDTFGSYTLVPVLAKFMELHPDIVIELNLTERHVDLIEERVDIAFRTGYLKNEGGLEVHEIGEAQTMIYASPAYIEKYGTPTSHTDLKKHKSIVYTRSPEWRMSKNGRTYAFVPKGHILTDSGETMREFCIRGQGLAFMPSMLAEFALRKKRLVQLLTDYDYSKMLVQAVRVRGKQAPLRVIKLLEFVIDELSHRPRDIAEFIQA